MLVSLITPTSERPHFLQGLYALIKKQSYTDWEWLIYDSSLRPQTFDDPRVRYHHDEGIVTIGEKRNWLAERAKGRFILHFDDDDYYGPTYIDFVVEQLKAADFYTSHSWFSYDLKSKQTYYWATDEITRTQFFTNALSGERVRELDFGLNCEEKKARLNQRGRKGYGFTYGYRKELATRYRFSDRDYGEDRTFFDAIEKGGCSIAMEADQEGRALHVIHETNTSAEYPQYRIPPFLAKRHLPDFFTHIARYYEN